MAELPKKGDTYVCKGCGMKIVVTHDCECDDAKCVTFECCDAPMALDPDQ